MINVKKFETEAEYVASEKVYPQVSHCLDTDNVWVEGMPVFNEIVLKVKGRGSSPIILYKGGLPSSDFVSSVMVDDVRQPLSPGLVLNDNKEHIVRLGMSQDCNTLKGLFCLDDSENNTSEIDFTNFNFASVKDVSYLFGNLSITNNNLKKIIWGDGTNLEGASFTNVEGLYCGCSSISKFDYSLINKAVTNNFSYMFYGCRSLKVMLDFPWNNKPLICVSMFQKCSSLEDVSMHSIGNTNNNNNYANMFNGVKSSGENSKYWINEKKYNGYGQLRIPSWYNGNIAYFGTSIFLGIMKGPKHGSQNDYGWKMYK